MKSGSKGSPEVGCMQAVLLGGRRGITLSLCIGSCGDTAFASDSLDGSFSLPLLVIIIGEG